MKIRDLTLIALVCSALVLSGCSPNKLLVWTGLAQKDVESRIDELFGKHRVMREEARQAIQAAQADMERLEEIAAASTVDAEMIEEQIAELQEREQASQEQLRQFATLIEEGEPVRLDDGTVWRLDDLRTMAQAKMVEHETLQQRIATYEESAQVYTENASQARAELTTARQNVANMQANLKLLEAKMSLLETLKNRPASAAGAQDVDQVLADADNLLQSLLDEVERETRIARERRSLETPSVALPDEPAPSDEDLVRQLNEVAGNAP